MKAMPKIEKFMTSMPHTVGNDMPIKKALEFMREYSCRHLPVLHGGKLVGVITDRDIKLAASFQDSETMKVEDVMSPDVYCVTPQTGLDLVVKRMAEHKYGCAIIQQENSKVVGIFTAIDALAVLEQVLHEHYKP